MTERLRVAVVGATGYIGMQAVALVEAHPHLELAAVAARAAAGGPYSDAVPGSGVDMTVVTDADLPDVDVILATLPHTVAASMAQGWLDRGALVVDMSADFRLRDVAEWERWYGMSHPAASLCAEAVYAIPEVRADDLRDADLIAAPGCLATAAILAVLPALRAGLVETDIVVDAKTGISGAGRGAAVPNLFAEIDGSLHAYKVAGHRHKAEMLQELSAAAGTEVHVTFVPHIVPMTRGILATAYLRPRGDTGPDDLAACFADFCAGHPALRLDSTPTTTKTVSGTALAALHVGWQDGVAVVTCAIDNLVRGGAGQGIQALNIRMGWDEEVGLPLRPTWP